MTLNEIIEVLRNDDEYYGGIGRQFLSNSDVGTLLTNPQNFGTMREDSKAFMDGRYFHQLILEPHKAVDLLHVDVSTRTTKEYKEFCKTNNVPYCMLTKEKQEVERLAGIIKSNIKFFDEIYRHDNEFEIPNIGNLFGVDFKGKADIVCNDKLIDLKTTSDIFKFKKSARLYNYDSQCYIYGELFGRPLEFYVIDKTTGVLGVFKPSEEFIEGGRQKVERAVEVYKRYFSDEAHDDVINFHLEDVL